jgi:hypothetical protein
MSIDGEILNKFNTENKMETPHDIALSEDGKSIFVAQLRPHMVFKVRIAKIRLFNSLCLRFPPLIIHSAFPKNA